MKIDTEKPLNRFAEIVAERTGIAQQKVAHVLAAAMVVAGEETDRRETKREGDGERQADGCDGSVRQGRL